MKKKVSLEATVLFCVITATITYMFHDNIKPFITTYFEPYSLFIFYSFVLAGIITFSCSITMLLYYYIRQKRLEKQPIISRWGVMWWVGDGMLWGAVASVILLEGLIEHIIWSFMFVTGTILILASLFHSKIWRKKK